jgi:hypothetical protein
VAAPTIEELEMRRSTLREQLVQSILGLTRLEAPASGRPLNQLS